MDVNMNVVKTENMEKRIRNFTILFAQMVNDAEKSYSKRNLQSFREKI